MNGLGVEETLAQTFPADKARPPSHGARPVHLNMMMIKWIRTSRLSIKNSLCVAADLRGDGVHVQQPRGRRRQAPPVFPALTVLYVALTVLHVALTVLYVALTVLYVALTVLYMTLAV